MYTDVITMRQKKEKKAFVSQLNKWFKSMYHPIETSTSM